MLTDSAHRRQPGLAPFGHLRAGLAQHPVADGDDDAGFLGHRNEIGGRQQAALRMPPAQQGLETAHFTGMGVDLRLIEQHEFVARQRAAQVGLDLHALGIGRLHAGFPELQAAAALRLGLVHGDFGLADQAVDHVAVIRRHAGADADRDVDFVALDVHRLGQHLDDLAADVVDVAARHQGRQQHGEFVAAQARQGVAFAQALAQPRADGEQQFVADGVAERVVDDLEVIEVEAQHRQRFLGALGLRQHEAEVVAEQRAVGQAGEQVVVGLVVHGFLGLLALGDILGDAVAADEALLERAGFLVVHAGGGQFDGLAAAIHQARAAHSRDCT